MGKSETRYELVYFILNSLHNIVNNGYYCCYCEEKRKCKIFSVIFFAFEKDAQKNMFDVTFLFWYYTKLCNELLHLFDQQNVCTECFQGEYKFRGRDWHTDEF